jgi:hypothetical protein
MKLQYLALVVVAALSGACGSAPDVEAAGATASQADMTSPGDVVGAYVGGDDAPFGNLVLDSVADSAGLYAYFANDKAGLISCTIGSGCTVKHAREEGTYTVMASSLTLAPTIGAPRTYAFVRNGDTLTLTDSGASASYTTIPSYCDTAADCAAEGLIRPYCASATSGWECNANACAWACWQ